MEFSVLSEVGFKSNRIFRLTAVSSSGNFVLHIRTKLYQKISQISDLLKKFTIFMMYKADKLAAEANVGWVIVFDCSEAGIVSI